MAEETVDQFLVRRERELTAQISALNGQIAPKEAELLQIRRVKAALKLGADLSESLSGETGPTASQPLVSANYDAVLTNIIGGRSMPPAHPAYHTMTIKELVIQALLDHFPLGGAAAAIREFIRDAYSRTIEAGSMRSQMHRLKADKILQHDVAKDIWDFALGKRALYDTYTQSPPPGPMLELQDDNTEEDNAFLEAAARLAWREEGLAEEQASKPSPDANPRRSFRRRL